MEITKRISAVFFKTETGNEPVRDWLKDLSAGDKKSVGADIMAVEMCWPVGYPQVRKMDSDLWEIRSHISDKRISRIFFTIVDNNMVLLHGYIKKSQTTPKEELDLAKKRRDMFLTGGSR